MLITLPQTGINTTPTARKKRDCLAASPFILVALDYDDEATGQKVRRAKRYADQSLDEYSAIPLDGVAVLNKALR